MASGCWVPMISVWSRAAAAFALRLAAIALVMASDLILAGLFQGFYWVSMQPWDASVNVSQPFWIVRLFAGLGLIGGQLCFVWNLVKTWQLSRAAAKSGVVVEPSTYNAAWSAT